MWFSTFILLGVTYEFFILFFVIVLLNTWIYYSIFSKTWWEKFNCNFKYIFINEIGFIKKIVLVVGKINKNESFTRWGVALQGPKGQG